LRSLIPVPADIKGRKISFQVNLDKVVVKSTAVKIEPKESQPFVGIKVLIDKSEGKPIVL
jgi:hypothetical protein